MSIGDNIKRLREEMEMTQAELAKEAGTYQPNISDWENGLIPGYSYLKKLAKIFGISINELIEERKERC